MGQQIRDRDDSIDTLNSFLRGELSAVETYRQALDKVDDPGARFDLETCMRSHQQRVDTIRDRILELGGEPAFDSGPWGVFAKLIEGSAKALGVKAAVSALEEGEDHGLNDYRDDMDKLDADSKRLVEEYILPEQERTHRTMSTLKHAI